MDVLIPARYSSLKTLFTVIRETDKITTHTMDSISGRSILFGDSGQWYYLIGGRNLPSTPVRKKERKMVTTPIKNAQCVACTRGCADGPAMWGDSAP